MKSACNISRDALGRFRDGALEGPKASQLATHVETCDRCQGALADLEALGELLVEQRSRIATGLPVDFAARVMGALPTQRPVRSAWTQRLAELVQRHRDALVLSLLGAAVAASLVVVFAPGLRSTTDRSQEAAENEAQIHQLEVTGSDQDAVVLQSAEGNTVIWLVGDEDGGTASPPPR